MFDRILLSDTFKICFNTKIQFGDTKGQIQIYEIENTAIAFERCVDNNLIEKNPKETNDFANPTSHFFISFFTFIFFFLPVSNG